MYQPPNAWVGVTHTFFNVSRLDKSCQYFKIVNEKNNMTFHISEQFMNFQSLQEKISYYKTENFIKLWIRGLRSISAAQGRPKRIGNSVKKPDIMNYVYMLAYVLKSSNHVEKEQDKPNK